MMLKMFDLCRATPEEVCRPLPGDEVIPHPIGSATHTITIDVPPDQVWPWLVQMGCDRAGWYSYDFVDNGGRRSASTINPAWQDLALGDVMPCVPGARDAFMVIDFTPCNMLLLGVPVVTTAGGASKTPASVHTYYSSWVHVLEEMPAHHTRLITRGYLEAVSLSPSTSGKPSLARFTTPSELLVKIILKLPRPVMAFIYRLGHFIMEQRHLVGIKQRAERQALAGFSSSKEEGPAGSEAEGPTDRGKVSR
jgi:hypothetical protein